MGSNKLMEYYFKSDFFQFSLCFVLILIVGALVIYLQWYVPEQEMIEAGFSGSRVDALASEYAKVSMPYTISFLITIGLIGIAIVWLNFKK